MEPTMNPAIQEAPRRPEVSRLRAALICATAAGIALVACSGEGDERELTLGNDTPATTVTVSPEASKDVCPAGFNMKQGMTEQFAKTAGANSLFPSLATVNDKGEITPDKIEVASQDLIDQICRSNLTLAAVTELSTKPMGYKDRIYLPGSKSIEAAQKTADAYTRNEAEALDDIKAFSAIAKSPEGLKYTDKFTVLENQATMVVVNRDAKGNVTGISFKKVTSGGDNKGFQLNPSVIGKDLNDQQRRQMQEAAELVLYTVDGNILIKTWIGEGEVSVTTTSSTTTTEKANDKSTSSSSSSTSAANNGGTGSSTSTANGGGNTGSSTTAGRTGGTTGTTGTTPGTGTGTTPGTGSAPGTTAGGGGGQQPGTTQAPGTTQGPRVTTPETTVPPTTARPPETTWPPQTTRPPETTVPPTTASTTTRPPVTTAPPTTVRPPATTKPPINCDPNIDVC